MRWGALLLLALAAPALADPRVDYNRAFRHGAALFDQGKWSAARAEFEAE